MAKEVFMSSNLNLKQGDEDLKWFIKKLILKIFPYFLYPLIIFIHLLSWIKGKLNRRQFLAKIGFLPPLLTKTTDQGKIFIWVHVASLGEFNTALPFLKKHQEKHNNFFIITYFNTDICQSPKLENITNIHFPLPFEMPWAYNYILAKYNIRYLFVFETEIWPVLFSIIQQKKIPLFGINAYINEENTSAYHKWFWLFRECFLTYHHLFVRKNDDKKEFIKLGVEEKNITVVGNLKLDILLPHDQKNNSQTSKKFKILSNYFNPSDPSLKKILVIILASIHEKEIPLLMPLINLNPSSNLLRWIIAPRYLDSLPLIKKTLEKQSQSYDLFSSLNKTPFIRKKNNVLILDEYGVLKEIYRYTDIAIIGGSFIPFGGQNMLEAIAHNIKTFTGPHYHHFQDIVEEFDQYLKVVNIKELFALVEKWSLEDKATFYKKEDNGYNHLLSHIGVSDKILKGLRKFILN